MSTAWRRAAKILLVVAAVSVAVDVSGQQPDVASPPAEAMAAMQAPIQSGLQFLQQRQRADGRFASRNMGGNPAVVALGGMAWLSSGSTPGRGPYGRNLSRSIDYIVAQSQPTGFIVEADNASHGPMYGHGFATLFLAEVYGMSERRDLREVLAAAVDLIVKSQNREGGWRYQPEPNDADISVTVCQIMALRAARNAGIAVPNETVDACIDYVKRCQNPDGGFSYMLGQRVSMFPRSAAGIVALNSAGIYDGPSIERGLAYLIRERPRAGSRLNGSHYFYGQYYAAQAMWHAGGTQSDDWYEYVSDSLVASQNARGSWSDGVAPEYATAMACIILQLPTQAIPIFQR